MYRTFILPLKSAFALAALFILTACGGFTLDLNLPTNSDCIANPFESECGEEYASFRQLIIDDCANNPEKSDTSLCIVATNSLGAPDAPSDDENGATGAGGAVVKEVVDNTPKDNLIKSELNKNSFTKTDKEKGGTTTLEIVDLCTNPATAHDKQCTPAVVDCINNPFSSICQSDDVLGNFVRGGVTVSKAVVLQDKRARDCRDGVIDRAQCQTLNSEKARCAGAAFSDVSCSAVTYSVCKADVFDPLCSGKAEFTSVYFSERSNVCFDQPNNPNCTGTNGHIAVVCSEYPFDRLCTGNANYDTPRETACRDGSATTQQCGNIVAGVCSGDPFDPLCDGIANYENVRANACEANPNVSPDCPVVELVELEEQGTELEVADVCLDNPFGPTCADSDYNNARKELVKTCAIQAVTGAVTTACDTIIEQVGACFIDPFSTACDGNHHAVKNYIGQLRSSRVALCESNLGGLAAWIAPLCASVPDTTPVGEITTVAPVVPEPTPTPTEVTASVWADSFAQGVLGETISGITGDTQFLKVTESDTYLNFPVSTSSQLDTGYVYLRDTLALDDLGGDRADGFGFFQFVSNTNNSQTRYYAGILPGTNLGAPLTQTTGSAKWTGVFNLDENDLYESFVLNIEFNGTGGSIEALIQKDIYDYHTTGSFNDAGVITGNVQIGLFKNPDPANRGRNDSDHQTATLTGLIGEEGAVGAFVGNDTRSGSRSSTYVGGFVARPSSSEELQSLAQTCANDPFNSLCALGYEAERSAVIERCIIGGNASDASCGSAARVNYCIKYPFGEECADRLPLYYEQARTSRLNFCLSSGNADNALCTINSTYDHICTNHPFSTQCIGDSDYRLIRRDACSIDPFTQRCAGEGYNDLRVSFCEGKVGTHPSCPAPTPQVTAKVWADSFDEDLAHGASADDTESKFLIGRETDLDTGGVRTYKHSSRSVFGGLNLADATFNGTALGGDATDGMVFFAAKAANNGWYYSYAGILSGTNLGAPLTDTIGSAKWIGSFQHRYRSPVDFVLNVSFGTGEGAGEIEALARSRSSYFDYHIAGEFDDAGVITGTAREGFYRTNDPDNRGRAYVTGKLTGLIGEEGAVGAFLLGSTYGGFVARPSSADELRTLEQTCADDPFNNLCTIGYESERKAVFEHCITGGNANDERCESANVFDNCIKDPFFWACSDSLPQYYEQLQENRVAFCRTVGNAGNALCTVEKTFAHICTNHPFDAQCLGDSDYDRPRQEACTNAGTGSTECLTLAGLTCGSNPFSSYCGGAYNNVRETACRNGSTNTQCGGIITGVCGNNPFDTLCGSGYTQNRRALCTDNPFAPRCAGEGYNDLRVTFCEGKVGKHQSCPAPEPTEVTAEVWADSFDRELETTLTSNIRWSTFLKGRATDLDNGEVASYSTNPDHNKGLNLADATFNGAALGGDVADGVAFFGRGRQPNNRKGYSYAGILSGTNLGAPLTDTQGSAKWIGSLRLEGGSPLDFILNISFGTGDGAGEIEALIQKYNYWYDYHIAGEFDDVGVITGRIRHGKFRTNDPNNRGSSYGSGKLTGLIGEQGAVGAFVSSSVFSSFFGGFVARPSSAEELQSLAQTCADDPFHEHCNIGYESERRTLVERCDLNPFISNCGWRYNDAREYACISNRSDARCPDVVVRVCNEDLFSELCNDNQVYFDERVTYCRSVLWDEPYCEEFKRTTCVLDPFNTFCGSRYAQNRRTTCTGDPFAPRCAGEGYNDLRVSFCEDNVGKHSSCPAPEPTITEVTNSEVTNSQVTAEVWADSFDEPLSHAASNDDTSGKFLIGGATNLDRGGVGLHYESEPEERTLTFANAIFNGAALGEDAADGVAFFHGYIRNDIGIYHNAYAGILSGTNLGAPLTNTEGSAKWLGVYKHARWLIQREFILNITFGGEGKAGSIEAIVDKHSASDLFIKGDFDDAGVITGNVYSGFFRSNDLATRANIINNAETNDYNWKYKLTGLIGEDGAVGVASNASGFVARPASVAELANVAQACIDDPFNKLCAMGYESERNAIVERCIAGGTANDEEICGSAIAQSRCIRYPFSYSCETKFNRYYQQAQANRLAFCGSLENVNDPLCISKNAIINVCKEFPSNPHCSGNVYREARDYFCEKSYNMIDPVCLYPRVTAKVWADSFETPLAHGATADDTESQFLISREDGLDTGGVGVLRVVSLTSRTTSLKRRHDRIPLEGILDLSDATFDGSSLNGDFDSGVAFFAAEAANDGGYYTYAGVLPGTNLGAPLTDTSGSTKWHGSFKTVDRSPVDFILNISFGTGAGAGEIEALVQTYNVNNVDYHRDYHIAGEFDDTGVITGTVLRGTFKANNPNNRGTTTNTGKLTGLIGEEGAVGAFVVDNFVGGFVVQPSSEEDMRSLTRACANDPLDMWCNIGYEAERNARIEHCIIGGNANDANCYPDREWYRCMKNPFTKNCSFLLPDYYEQARANRLVFCRTAGNEDNTLCNNQYAVHNICTNFPFDAQCRGNNDYRPIRRTACTDNPFATRCAGDAYNDLRVSFCENNANNSACPRPVAPTTDRVTAADWVDSFDGNLRKTPDMSYSERDLNPQTGRYPARKSFVEGNADGLDTGTLLSVFYESYKHRDIKMNILNFDTATFDGKYLNGDAEDGLAFFTGVQLADEENENNRYHGYAGILSTTDLGAPLNQTGSATWYGTIILGNLYGDDTDFSLDIVFNGATGGTLSAFIAQNARSWFLNEPRYHAKLAGTFDANGVITGTLDTGVFIDSDPNKPKQPGPGNSINRIDILSGLIGEEGAIGLFQKGGGFVVRPSEAFMSQAPLVNNARVTTADWLESFDVALSAAPAYRNAPTPYDIFGYDNPYRDGVYDPNEFLQGSKTGMSLRNGPGTQYKVLTLADSTLDGQSLGGDASDGLAIAREHYVGSHYASILSGSDLGAPLTQNQGTVNWYGTFRVLGWHHVNRDFELRINFGAGDSAGTLNAFVGSDHVNTYHYRINGVFDDNGVITGAVELGNFGGQDAALPTYDRRSGVLRGLIGEEGAIAVFIGDEVNYNGYVGGFVATPDLTSVVSAVPVADTSPNRVTASDWLESFDTAPSAIPNGNLNTRFLENDKDAPQSPEVRWYRAGDRDYEKIAFAPIIRNEGEKIKTISQGAFFASSKDGKYVYFAGILETSDLGAPLISSDVPVYWYGRFQASLPYEIEKALTLKVSFNGGENHVGEVEAFVKDSGDLYYYLKGDFDNKGVITGTVKYGDISDRNNNPSRRGVLTGLIGVAGASGAFVANINNGFGDYSGGFIAYSRSGSGIDAPPTTTPTPAVDTTPNRVTTADWLAGFDRVPDAVPDSDNYYNINNKFLRSTDGTLNTGVRGNNAPDVSILTLADTTFGDNRGDADDGIAMFNYRHNKYAGILTNTDLGAPLTQTDGTAEWEGRFQTTEMEAKDFTLEIDFGNREVEAFVHHRRTNDYYYMTGTFDRNGLMKGAVDSGGFTNGNRETPEHYDYLPPAEMRGLIGQEGAVGVFISDTGYDGYSGGFVARPPSE